MCVTPSKKMYHHLPFYTQKVNNGQAATQLRYIDVRTAYFGCLGKITIYLSMKKIPRNQQAIPNGPA